ncbi:MAG: hypothetical protein IJ067_08170 [Prevotella sp.]|nr:hypothetical protein [Prevotella sp.]
MPSFKDLGMAAAVSAYKKITIKKSLFSKKAIYTPTQSPLKVIIQDYTPTEGERLERLLNMPLDKMVADIEKNGAPKSAPIGHFRFEACISEDGQFCAIQLFRFIDFKNSPVFEPRFYEGGKDVEAIAKLF